MTWLIKSYCSHHFTLLYIIRGVSSAKKRKKIPSAFKKCCLCHALLFFGFLFHSTSSCSEWHTPWFPPRRVRNPLVSPLQTISNRVISSAAIFLICIHLPHPNNNLWFFSDGFHLGACPLRTDTTNWFHIKHTAQPKYIFLSLDVEFRH